MKIYCQGELTTMRIRGRRWVCDRCGKKLWKADMAKRKTPKPEDVSYVYVYAASDGIRYTARGKEGQVIYDSPYVFRSRYDARRQIHRLWPGVLVSFE